MDVVEEGWIGDDEIDASVRQAGLCRVAAREVDAAWGQAAAGRPARFNFAAERGRTDARLSVFSVDFRRRFAVVDGPQQSALKKIQERSRAFLRTPDVGFD